MHCSKKELLFDHLVGAAGQGGRHVDAQRLYSVGGMSSTPLGVETALACRALAPRTRSKITSAQTHGSCRPAAHPDTDRGRSGSAALASWRDPRPSRTLP